jgi:hypothetical protein
LGVVPGTAPAPLFTGAHGGRPLGVCDPGAALPGVELPGDQAPGVVVLGVPGWVVPDVPLPGDAGELCDGLGCPGAFCVPGVALDELLEFGVELCAPAVLPDGDEL